MVIKTIKSSVIISLLCILASCAEMKEAGRTIGHTTRNVTREIGYGSRDTVKAIGRGTKRVVNEVVDEPDSNGY